MHRPIPDFLGVLLFSWRALSWIERLYIILCMHASLVLWQESLFMGAFKSIIFARVKFQVRNFKGVCKPVASKLVASL